MSILFIFRGLPASGKSTLAKSMLKDEHSNRVRVNKDDLRTMLYDGNYSISLEDHILKIRDSIIEMYSRIGFDVLVDDTNLNPKHLERLSFLAESLGMELNIINMTTTLHECINRDSKRPNPVGEKVIRDMYEKYLK